tara:strand:- start:1493 stop:2200 length:708 start_codon:yes stop_codon:yes gene_type:complete
MASSYTNDIKLELMTTGEKAGQWGTITNTNLQILEQATTGYLSLAVGGADVNLVLTDGVTSNGKNIFFELTGTLTGNRIITMPNSAERIFIVKDTTNRSSSHYSLTIKTVSGSGVVIPSGATAQVFSNGTNVSLGLLTKGYYSTSTAYTAVPGDQVIIDTTAGVVTLTLPSSPSVGDEVTIIDGLGTFATNNLTVGRNSSNINGAGSDLTVSTNGSAFTLVFLNATRGWAYKDKV